MHEMFADVMTLSTKDIVMMARALEYVAEVRSTRKFQVLIETTGQGDVAGASAETTGGPGAVHADEIHVIDLKTGMIPVEVVDNEQLHVLRPVLRTAGTEGEGRDAAHRAAVG